MRYDWEREKRIGGFFTLRMGVSCACTNDFFCFASVRCSHGWGGMNMIIVIFMHWVWRAVGRRREVDFRCGARRFFSLEWRLTKKITADASILFAYWGWHDTHGNVTQQHIV